MRSALVIAGREIQAAAGSPATYFFAASFLLVAGVLFVTALVGFSDVSELARARAAEAGDPAVLGRLDVDAAVVRPLVKWLALLLVVVVPLLTMRLLADDRRTGTMELLLTAPVSAASLVLGKFLGGLTLALAPLAGTLVFPALLFAVARPDPGPLVAGYLGLFLAAALFTSVGLLASALTDSSLLAAFLCFVMLVSSALAGALSESSMTPAGALLGSMSALRRLQPLTEGAIDTGAIAFFAAATAGFLFLTQRVIESRRWR